ncbi:hypothetical protein OEZ85_010038 [Tetradesmus obliquus]|uniref:Uncharacterized protein n=1 Tax=Tetradesmus obliquus TaxID=3088 RepID=A0ABY8UAW4_TETOB|nr:hypothetical protein OEZ85_010038 [Tetradesmus obliquus]
MAAMQQAAELRRAKEQFVSNLHGTTKWEVFCVVSCLPLCLLIAAYAEAWVAARGRATGKALSRALLGLPKFWFEFGLVVVPQLLLLMSLAPAEPAFLLLFLLWGSLALKLWMKLGHSPGSRQHMAHMLAHISAPRKRFVSVFRGGVMLTTCLAILGVDFAAFPRRYAKAEAYGTGLMDVGVGAVVWAGGLVSAASSAAAAAAQPAAAALESRAGKHRGSWAGVWGQRLGRGLRAALPLVVLGGGRLVSTWAVGYQQHVGEYGLSWNFFWSIAAVSLATLALPVPPAWLGPVGLAVSAAHQALLSSDLRLAGLMPGHGTTPAAAAAHGSGAPPVLLPVPGSLGAWLHAELPAEQRAALGFLTANKEGLGSLPGYWALHLLGAALGRQLAAGCAAAAAQGRACLAAGGNAGGGSSRAAAAVGECARVVWSWVGRLLLADCAVWLALLAAETWLEPVSRRSCNLAYVLWVTAQCMTWLLLCLMGDLLTSGLAGGASSSPASPIISSRMAARGSSSTAEPAAGAAALLATAPGSAAAAAGNSSSSSSGSSSGGPMRLMLAWNRNMLALFLAANLLTGAVNLSINTLAVGRWGARSIVGLYMLVLCGLAVLLDSAGVTLKPW